jgi:UDP-N-acetylmuramoyl-L-alanine---L-glutamate ligase
MKLTNLSNRSLLILGFGVEGISTYKFLRELFPENAIGVADQRLFDRLPAEAQKVLPSDSNLRLHLGEDYLSSIQDYEVIIKSPGISLAHAEIQQALSDGKTFTSQTEIFFSNCPSKIVGVTGTKGKGTTCKLIHSMLKAEGRDVHLIGNIGTPSLPFLKLAQKTSVFIYELSAQQLETLTQSPHIAVLLNIVPDHLDHFGTFENYVQCKANITRHQTPQDFLVYNLAFPLPRRIAEESDAQIFPYSIEETLTRGCYLTGDDIIYASGEGGREKVLSVREVEAALPGAFNLHNVLPAIAVSRLLGVEATSIASAISGFEPLDNRFEQVGTYRGITFYNASIATVPEVTIEHLKALGENVQTVLLGGFDRGIDFSELGHHIVARSNVRNVILFPTTGSQIWRAITRAADDSDIKELPNSFSIVEGRAADAMKTAVTLAFRHTAPGKICLHSPASPSFGIFKDFKERGSLFKEYVNKIGEGPPDLTPDDDEYWEYDLTGEE